MIGYDAANDVDLKIGKVEIRDVSTGNSSFTNLSEPHKFTGYNGKLIYYNSQIIIGVAGLWRSNLDFYNPQSSTRSIG